MARQLRFLASLAMFLALTIPAVGAPFVSIRGYQIDPPAGWTASTPQGAIDSLFAKSTTSKPPPSISVGVLMIPDDSTISPAQYVHDTVLSQEKVLPAYTLISDTTIQLGVGAGYSLAATFKGSSDGPVLKIHQFFCGHGKVGYVLTGTALASEYDSVSAEIEKSLASFGYTTAKAGPFMSPDGYSLIPPKGWNVKADAGTNGAYFVQDSTSSFSTTISVKSQVLTDAVTVDQLYDGRQELIDGLTTGMTDVKVDKQELTTLASEHGMIIDLSFAAQGVKDRIWIRQYYILHAQRLYVITIMSPEPQRSESLRTLAAVLDSFTWTTPALTVAPTAAIPAGETAASPSSTIK